MFKKSVILSVYTLMGASCFATNDDIHTKTPPTTPHSTENLSREESEEKLSEETKEPTISKYNLGNYKIQIYGKNLPIKISDELREKIDSDSDISEKFRHSLEKLQKSNSKPSKQVEGYYLFLNQGKIYTQTYLGRKAK
ncbi:MAG: hypothetical protein HEEMFOPI_01578 [Holosporales bacterium]